MPTHELLGMFFGVGDSAVTHEVSFKCCGAGYQNCAVDAPSEATCALIKIKE